MKLKLTLKMLAPYIAIGIFWSILSNAWLAILAYHLQIIFWSRSSLFHLRKPQWHPLMLAILPMALAGPLYYLLLPWIPQNDLTTWLSSHHLSQTAFLIMIPYFGLLHPYLEQLHWEKLREATPLAHIMFGGYHLLVLHSLLPPPWIAACLALLIIASILWKQMNRKCKSLLIPIASHIAADLGLILAVHLKM